MNALSKIAISDLTVEECLELIEALWDSLEDYAGLSPAQMEKRDRHLAMIDGPVPASHLAELERRMENFEQDKADSVPWDVFREQLANNTASDECTPSASGPPRKLMSRQYADGMRVKIRRLCGSGLRRLIGR